MKEATYLFKPRFLSLQDFLTWNITVEWNYCGPNLSLTKYMVNSTLYAVVVTRNFDIAEVGVSSTILAT